MIQTDKQYEGLKPKKGTPEPNIRCVKCKEFSGYTNDMIVGIRVPEYKTLNCKNCGHPTIKLIPTGYPATQ